MRELIKTSASIEYGILIAFAVAIVLLLTMSVLNSRKQLNALSYMIAALLMVPLTFQMSWLVGAYNVSHAASEITDLIGMFSPELQEYASSLTQQDVGWFVFRRIVWSVLFTAIAGVLIYITMDRKRQSRRADKPRNVTSGRRYTAAPRRRR